MKTIKVVAAVICDNMKEKNKKIGKASVTIKGIGARDFELAAKMQIRKP